jgi:hypothetical protein
MGLGMMICFRLKVETIIIPFRLIPIFLCFNLVQSPITEDGEPIALTIPMMGLVFMLCGDSCYVWATNFKIFNAEAPIYHVPLPNIYGDGRICMGNENSFSSQLEGIEKLAEAWQMFMNAPFSNHLVNDKSTSHPQDIRLKLLQLQKSNRYPIADLVQCGSSVKVAINMIINR